MPHATTSSKPRSRWPKIIAVIAFVALNVVVIVATAMSEFGGDHSDATDITEIRMNGWFLIPAVLCLVLATVANIYKYVIMMRHSYTQNPAPSNRKIWKTAWRVVMLGKYYDNITPAAVGGQPFQIYYMRKHSHLPKGAMTSIPIVGMIAGQLAMLIVAPVAFLFGHQTLSQSPALLVAAWLGLLIFAFWPFVVVMVNCFPKPTTKILRVIIKFLAKIKLIKNRKSALAKIEEEVAEYTGSIKSITKTKGLLIKVVSLAVIYTIAIATIPFFLLQAFGGNVDLLSSLVLTLAVTSAVYVVPTPGNSGAAEGAFYLVFSALSTGYIFWAMLIWRLLIYYFYIIVGAFIYLAIQIEKKCGKINK